MSAYFCKQEKNSVLRLLNFQAGVGVLWEQKRTENLMKIFELKCRKSVVIAGFMTCVCMALFAPEQAHAGYLDPGSGSTAVQWVIAAIASLGRVKRQFFDTVSKVFGR